MKNKAAENKQKESTEEKKQHEAAEKNNADKQQKNAKKKTNKKEEKKYQEHEEKINQLEKQLEENNDKFLRLYSEFDNFRKRTLNEKLELTKNASSELTYNLLPVLDDFERAIKSFDQTENAESIKEGIILIYNKFKGILEQKGVKEMTVIGEPFDTEVHEAMTQIPAEKEEMKNKVVDVIEKGYFMNDKVLRYAKVIVGK